MHLQFPFGPILGADVGGTNDRVSYFDTPDATVPISTIDSTIFENPQRKKRRNFEQDYQDLKTLCRQQIEAHGPVVAMGIGVAGFMDRHRTKLLKSGNLPHWVHQLFVRRLSADLGVPVFAGNDCEAAALAEAINSPINLEDFWFFILGTGFGTCQMIRHDGLWIPRPGEGGHAITRLWDNMAISRKCGCGEHGHLEAFIGGGHIEEIMNKPVEKFTRDHDWSHVLDWLTVGVYNILTTQPTGQVIFSGGLICKQSWMLYELKKRLQDMLGPLAPHTVRLSTWGESAGTLGAKELCGLTA